MGRTALPTAKRPKLDADGDSQRRLIIVLEKCTLEMIKKGSDYYLMTSDKDTKAILNSKRDPSHFRPDIVHQCLMMLLDSPLNRAGLLQVYVHTTGGVLIEVHPQLRIPRTFNRFSGVMCQLLRTKFIRASNNSVKLLRLIKNPVDEHFPVGCRKILTSFQAGKLVKSNEITSQDDNKPTVIVVGGFAVGKVSVHYTEEEIKISNFPLSAALTCAKLTSGFEECWNVESRE